MYKLVWPALAEAAGSKIDAIAGGCDISMFIIINMILVVKWPQPTQSFGTYAA